MDIEFLRHPPDRPLKSNTEYRPKVDVDTQIVNSYNANKHIYTL